VSVGLRRVELVLARDDLESVLARILDLVPEGVEQIDEGDQVRIAAYVDVSAVARLRRDFPAASSTPVEPGWEESWKAFHRPVRAGGLWIGPPWLEAPGGEPTVVIDPGRAFGTGAHATTRLCVELLAGVERGSLLDVGCGSGVLSIAAARLGFGPLVAVDSDPVAVEATKANAARNGVPVGAECLDITAADPPAADVATANIALMTVERLLPRLDARVAITSGYLATEHPAAPGWTRAERREVEGWAADVLRR